MSKNSEMQIGKSFIDFVEIFERLYPNYSDGIYFDVLQNVHRINLHVFDQSYPDEFTDLDEKRLLYFMTIIGYAIRGAGYSGGNFTKNIVADGLYKFGFEREINPFRDWLEGLKWDGRERMGTWFHDVIGAEMDMLDAEDERTYLKSVTVAWAMGVVGRQYSDAVQADTIPLLIGDQRIGKSNCIRLMAGKDEWYIDSPSDMSNMKEFLEGVWGAVIVELSEATAIRSKDSERTKANISKRKDRLRKAYEKASTTIARRFTFIASSNLITPFSDITGNMRYFPIYCNDNPTNLIKKFLDNPALAKYEVEQFWAEAVIYYKEGKLPNVPDSVKVIAEQVQDYASKHNEAVDYLNDYLDADPVFSQKGAFITREDIYRILMESSLTGMELRQTKDNFIFVWNNSKGCDWRVYRKTEQDSFGDYRRKRGFIRVAGAGVSHP